MCSSADVFSEAMTGAEPGSPSCCPSPRLACSGLRSSSPSGDPVPGSESLRSRSGVGDRTNGRVPAIGGESRVRRRASPHPVSARGRLSYSPDFVRRGGGLVRASVRPRDAVRSDGNGVEEARWRREERRAAPSSARSRTAYGWRVQRIRPATPRDRSSERTARTRWTGGYEITDRAPSPGDSRGSTGVDQRRAQDRVERRPTKLGHPEANRADLRSLPARARRRR